MRVAALLGIPAVVSLSLFCAQAGEPESLVFILAGQSNMLGHGDPAALDEAARKQPENVAFFLSGKPARFLDQRRFGPELSFAQEVSAAFPGKKIILVKHAVAGTSLLEWAPEKPLYRELMAAVASATRDKEAAFAAVLWMQGERDARFPAAAERYADNFKKLVERMRRDLKSPSLPFVYGQIAPPAREYPGREQVRLAQEKAEEMIPHVKMVSTDGLGRLADGLHYDSAGLIELGKRFAQAFLQMRKR